MQLNIPNLTKLAEWLEGGALHEKITFNMRTGMDVEVNKITEAYDPEKHNACTTACCIAGAAVQFFNTPQELIEQAFHNNDVSWKNAVYDEDSNEIGGRYSVSWDMVRAEAIPLLFGEADDPHDKLRIDTLANSLFVPAEDWGGGLAEYSDPKWAARVVRNLIATGQVDWLRTYEGDIDDAPFYDEYKDRLREERGLAEVED